MSASGSPIRASTAGSRRSASGRLRLGRTCSPSPGTSRARTWACSSRRCASCVHAGSSSSSCWSVPPGPRRRACGVSATCPTPSCRRCTAVLRQPATRPGSRASACPSSRRSRAARPPSARRTRPSTRRPAASPGVPTPTAPKPSPSRSRRPWRRGRSGGGPASSTRRASPGARAAAAVLAAYGAARLAPSVWDTRRVTVSGAALRVGIDVSPLALTGPGRRATCERCSTSWAGGTRSSCASSASRARAGRRRCCATSSGTRHCCRSQRGGRGSTSSTARRFARRSARRYRSSSPSTTWRRSAIPRRSTPGRAATARSPCRASCGRPT